MRELLGDFLRAHPECAFRALGAGCNRAALDLAPFGRPIEFLDAAAHPRWVERYHAANQARFGGPLALPGWVLVDLYLMPAAIGLLTCPARHLDPRPEGLDDDEEAVAAAYYAAPTLFPGTVVGVSLISLREGLGGAALTKAVTLRMLRAYVQRGITQWNNRALRVHTRLGPLRVEGAVPSVHGKAGESFAYAIDLPDDPGFRAAMSAPLPPPHGAPPPGARWLPVGDLDALQALLRRAEDGERVEILPPGLSSDGRAVLVRTED